MQKNKNGFLISLLILLFFMGMMAGCFTKKPTAKEKVTVGPNEEVIVVPKDRNVFIPGEKILEIPGEGEGGGTLIQNKIKGK